MTTHTRNTLLPILLVGGLSLAGCAADEPGALPETDGPVDVTASRAATAAASETFPAQITAERRATVATRTSGRILEITVDVGEPVREGQPLVRLDDEDVRARVEAAEAQATLARRSFARIESLAADGAASEQELDEARARLDGAEAALRDARTQLNYVVVSAPFDGVVESRTSEPGDLAAPGRPLLQVVGRSGLQIEADLPSSASGRIAVGRTVRVSIPGAGVTAPARVTRVAPALEPGSRRLRVEAVFEPALRAAGAVVPGAYARLEIEDASTGSLWIPEDAVIHRGQLTGVFQVTDGELRLRWIRLGRSRPGAVEVLAGPPGELVVVRNPGPTLRDGLPTDDVELVDWSVS
ncbi:MAG: efflux RND transporter periplasmic adaptor subunit [Gemmatimonadota bacterium]